MIPPEVAAEARRRRNKALLWSFGVLVLSAILPVLGAIAVLFALHHGFAALGLWHGAWWAFAALPVRLQERGDVQAHFGQSHTCTACGEGAAPPAHYCWRCGNAFVVEDPPLGAQLGLAFRRLLQPQPVEPARSQAFLLRPGHETTAKWLGVAVLFVLVGMFLTSLLGFVEDIGVTLIVFAPSVLLLFWLRQQDHYEVEPLGVVALAFGWGVLCGFFAGPLNSAIEDAFGLGGMQAGPVEETLKVLFVVGLAAHRHLRRELNGPVDGLVYGAAAGLGFAAMENFAYVQDAFLTPWGEGALWIGALVRLGGVLAHAVWAGLAGGFLGLMLLRHGRITTRNVVAAVAPPALLHALHNGLASALPADAAVLFLVLDPVLLGIAAYAFFKLLHEGQRDEVAWGYAEGRAPDERVSAVPR
jgi:RsiW-degrading membrane proteinase PrsW (M82 family)